jgi:hypothetical protein
MIEDECLTGNERTRDDDLMSIARDHKEPAT